MLHVSAKIPGDIGYASVLHPTISGKSTRQNWKNLCANWTEHPKKALKGIHRGKFSLTVAKDYRVLYSFNASTQEVFCA